MGQDGRHPIPDIPGPETDGVAVLALGRVDNRDQLGAALGVAAADLSSCADGELMRLAYRKWGEDCPGRIHGDWCLAAWCPAQEKLFLARDPYGQTALYYREHATAFAFSSARKALLAPEFGPLELDECYLAETIACWSQCEGERTVLKGLRRLPPAHCLTVSRGRLWVRQYWRLEDTPELRLGRRADYVEAFQDVFLEALRARMRGPFPGQEPPSLGVTLSGGLDSSAVAALAAGLLAPEGRRLQAFTAVPCFATAAYVGERFGDEYPYAAATARLHGNIDLHAVPAAELNPIQGIRRMLAITGEPMHAAANLFWLLEVIRSAKSAGCEVLLTGQQGNAGISWAGWMASQPLAFQVDRMGWGGWIRAQLRNARHRLGRLGPEPLVAAYRRWRAGDGGWLRSTPIHPEFARRLNLERRWWAAPEQIPCRTPRENRCRILLPGRSLSGCIYGELKAAFGIEILDPTADARVLAFTLSIPDDIFMDPATGQDRWLIREAMKGRLPEEVRLNTRRGRQAADLVPRLRACASEVTSALDALAKGPAAAFINVPFMREGWELVRAQDTPLARNKAGALLARGIMAGLFVNEFFGYG